MDTITYGPGGFDPDKPDDNIVAIQNVPLPESVDKIYPLEVLDLVSQAENAKTIDELRDVVVQLAKLLSN